MTTPLNLERVTDTLRGRVPDAIGIAELVYWPTTVERWHTEGLPADQTPEQYFGTDVFGRSISIDLSLQLEEQLLSEDEAYVLKRNANGVVVKEAKGDYIPPTFEDHVVRDRKSWQEYAPKLVPALGRFPPDYRKRYEDERKRNCFVLFKTEEPCWACMKLMGYERTLLTMVQEPTLLADIFATYTNLIISLYELLQGQGIEFDGAWLNGDLCYNKGMLFSPAAYRELLLPFHRRLCAYFRARRMPVVTHCCGDVRRLIPLYIEAGFNAFHPLEARAGNDVRELKQLYGSQAVFIGNISTDILGGASRADIEREIRSKLAVAKQGGGYIFHSDHSIPPTVSFDNYCFALELAQEAGTINDT